MINAPAETGWIARDALFVHPQMPAAAADRGAVFELADADQRTLFIGSAGRVRARLEELLGRDDALARATLQVRLLFTESFGIREHLRLDRYRAEHGGLPPAHRAEFFASG